MNSINGKKFNTPQWDRNDEIQDCSVPDLAPSKAKASRDTTFCRDVTIEGNLVVEGNVVIRGNLTVTGTVEAPLFEGTATRAIRADTAGAIG